LITISGIEGSGKSSCVKQIVALANSCGARPVSLRFQRLGCFLLLQKAFYRNVLKANFSTHLLKEPPVVTNSSSSHHFKCRRLSFFPTMIYTLRIVLFRLYRFAFFRSKLVVLDRYFYDNLAQFHIEEKCDRAFFFFLKRIIPQPDLAIMLYARNEVIKMRRPHRSLKHITSLSQGYNEVHQRFDNIVVICSDNVDKTRESIRKLMRISWAHLSFCGHI